MVRHVTVLRDQLTALSNIGRSSRPTLWTWSVRRQEPRRSRYRTRKAALVHSGPRKVGGGFSDPWAKRPLKWVMGDQPLETYPGIGRYSAVGG